MNDDLIDIAQWIEDKLDTLRANMVTLKNEGPQSDRAYWQSNGVSIGYLEVLVHLQKYGVAITNGRAVAKG